MATFGGGWAINWHALCKAMGATRGSHQRTGNAAAFKADEWWLKWRRENVFEHLTTISVCEDGELPWIQQHSAAFIPGAPTNILSPREHHDTKSLPPPPLPIPLSFDSLEGDDRMSLLGNWISWVNAKKWLCSIRGSTLFRPIAVVQWARNLTNTNLISSVCPVLDRGLKLCDCYSSRNPSGEKYNIGQFYCNSHLFGRYGTRRIKAAPQYKTEHKKHSKSVICFFLF